MRLDWSRLLEPLWSGPDGGAGRRPGVREQLEPSGRSVGHQRSRGMGRSRGVAGAHLGAAAARGDGELELSITIPP
eukprot:SAG31_NODE_607_length_13606_cov_11.366699_7_plen_76_part_00